MATFSKITRRTRKGRSLKFGRLSSSADLSNLKRAPKSFDKRLGVSEVFVPKGKRLSSRTVLISNAEMTKARIEQRINERISLKEAARRREEGTLDYLTRDARTTAEKVKARNYTRRYVKNKRGATAKHGNVITFESFTRDQKRFLDLLTQKNSVRYSFDPAAPDGHRWTRTPIDDHDPSWMDEDDWAFAVAHYEANKMTSSASPQNWIITLRRDTAASKSAWQSNKDAPTRQAGRADHIERQGDGRRERDISIRTWRGRLESGSKTGGRTTVFG